MRRPTLAIAALIAALSGCGKHATDPTGGAPGPPAPELVASQPVPRATGVLYDSEIWGQFSRALDGRTVTPTSVFLKLDGQRIPIAVSYDGISRRIFLEPTVTLELQRTYTVEFATAVHAADGTPIASGVFFQFTTNSLRRVVYDYPLPGALEGPVSALGWGGTQGPINNLLYEVYASTDSLAVESRSVPSLVRSVFTRLVPATAWPLGGTVYWAITSENVTTHERLAGPVRSFRILDTSTPIDSVTISALDHGSNDTRVRGSSYCSRLEVPCGPNFNGSIHWDYGLLPANIRMASASIRLITTDPYVGSVPAAQPTVWMAQNDWTACSVLAPGPPFNELSGFLASGVAASASEADFSSDRLAGLIEAQYRRRTLLYGTLVRAGQNISFHSRLVANPSLSPRVVVRFYRVPPPAAP